MGRLLEFVRGAADRRHVVQPGRIARPTNRGLDPVDIGRRQTIAVLVDGLLNRIGQRVRLIARVDQLAPRLILGGMRLCVPDHAIHVVLAETGRGR